MKKLIITYNRRNKSYDSAIRSYVSRIEKRALTKMLREYIKNKNN